MNDSRPEDRPPPSGGDTAAERTVVIDVHEVTRVEGHGNIHIRVDDGYITRLEFQIVESPRFFESFVRGRPYDEVPHMTARVCGICSIAHTSAATKAIEAACGITPSPQTLRLRKLMMCGEILQSHVLHLYFLAAPDYLGVSSVIPLAQSHPDVVKRALRLKKLANDVAAVVGGRHIHPVAFQVGGFTNWPAPQQLADLRQRLCDARADLAETTELFAKLPMPEFERDSECIGLRAAAPSGYSFYDGEIVSTYHDAATPAAEYRARIAESILPHATAKHAHSPNGLTYRVGALSRFKLNSGALHPLAREVVQRLGLTPTSNNPFHNNTAQLVECVECLESAIAIIDEVLGHGTQPEVRAQPDHFGHGVGIVEAPRGTLIHEYDLDAEGRVRDANLIIPTSMNLPCIEADMRQMTPELMRDGMTTAAITARLEMLVRSYDPCISCATHFLHVEWV